MEIKNVGMILKTMAIVLLILGVIGSFFIFAALGDILYRNGLLRFFILLYSILISVITWLLMYGFGQLIEDTGKIKEQLSVQSANLSDSGQKSAPSAFKPMYPNAVKNSTGAPAKKEEDWTCSCGRINSPVVSTCACGRKKSDSQ